MCLATISTTISIVDKMTGTMQGIINSVQKTIDILDEVDSATSKGFDTSKIDSARRIIDEVNAEYQETQEQIKKAADNQETLNQKLSTGKTSASSFVKAIAGLSVVQKVLSLVTGQLDSAISRMDTMTNFNRTMTAVTGSADLASASLSELKTITKGTAYGLDTAASAVQNFTTRGMSIGNATSEVGKWADAVSFYGDGTNETLETVQDALGKMMSKGTVEMEQLNRLTDAGINAVGIYAQATGQSTSSVQDDLSSGKISAMDFITTTSTAFEEGTNGVLSIAGAAKEAGGTWATSISNMKAAVTRGLISVIDSINEGLTNAGFGTILDGITNFGDTMETVLGKIGDFANRTITMLSPLLNLIKNVGSFVIDNWSIIEPILGGIVTALGLYYTAQLAMNTINGIAAGIESVKAFAETVHTAALAKKTGATFAATAAQYGFNAALLACPLTWIVIAIIAVIAIIYAVIAVINKVKDTTISATGIILGVLAWTSALILDIIIGIINSIIQIIYSIFVEPFIGIIEWVLNAANGGFNSFGDAVANLIGQIISWFLSLGKVVTTIIDAIFGTDWTAGLSSLQDTVTSWGTNDNAEKIELETPQISRLSLKNAYNTGYSAGEKIDSKIKGLTDSLTTDNSTTKQLQDLLDSTENNTSDTASNTSDIADSLSATSEDLKYIRDIAEQEAINRFTTAEITVNMTNNNNVNNDTDLDGIAEHLRTKIEAEMYAVSEGVY
jgi:tape measure domain-containing protein